MIASSIHGTRIGQLVHKTGLSFSSRERRHQVLIKTRLSAVSEGIYNPLNLVERPCSLEKCRYGLERTKMDVLDVMFGSSRSGEKGERKECKNVERKILGKTCNELPCSRTERTVRGSYNVDRLLQYIDLQKEQPP